MQSSALGASHRESKDTLLALEELTVKLEDKTYPRGNKERAKAREQQLVTGEGRGPGKRQGD